MVRSDTGDANKAVHGLQRILPAVRDLQMQAWMGVFATSSCWCERAGGSDYPTFQERNGAWRGKIRALTARIFFQVVMGKLWGRGARSVSPPL